MSGPPASFTVRTQAPKDWKANCAPFGRALMNKPLPTGFIDVDAVPTSTPAAVYKDVDSQWMHTKHSFPQSGGNVCNVCERCNKGMQDVQDFVCPANPNRPLPQGRDFGGEVKSTCKLPTHHRFAMRQQQLMNAGGQLYFKTVGIVPTCLDCGADFTEMIYGCATPERKYQPI